MAPRGSLWLLVPASGGPCWTPNATLVLLYGHSSATLLPLSLRSHSTATRLPFYCHSTTTLLCHSSATLPTTLLCHPSATLLPLHCCPTATLLPLYCHSFAIVLPLYCHSWATPLALYCHSPATWDHGSPNLPHPTPSQASRAPMQRQIFTSSPLKLS